MSPKTPSASMAVLVLATIFSWGAHGPALGQTMQPPGFHHLHLNSVDPEAAISFYAEQFPSTARASWGGFPALKSPNNVLVLFNKVATLPTIEPQSAFWHFGWHVTDVRKNLATYQGRPGVKLRPLYTTEEGGFVFVSSDTWPGTGGVLGLTKAQIADAKAKGVKPAGGAHRGRLQGGAHPGSQLAGARAGGDVQGAHRRGHLRGCRVALVCQPGRQAALGQSWTAL
jgi:predicted enzyme related to lactoylglutathione lyase